MDTLDSDINSWPRRIAVLLGAYCLVGGIVSLSGWVFDIRDLTDWIGVGISIQPNTSLVVAIAGAAVLFLAFGSRLISAVLGGMVLLVGGLTVFQIVTEIDLGIDTLLMFGREWGRGGVLSPGRMGVPSSTSWTLLGLAFILLNLPVSEDQRRRYGNTRLMAAVLAISTLAISSLSIIGYMFGAETLYALPRYTVIALQTATFIFSISLALILTIEDVAPMRIMLERGPAGTLARRVFPAAIAVPLVVGFLRVTGERAGFYDQSFGTAMRTVVEIALLLGLLWWTAAAIRKQAAQASEAEHKAREFDHRLAGVLGSVTDSFITVDKDWRFTYANDVHLERLGRSLEEIIGKNCWELFPNAVGTEMEKHLRRAMAERVTTDYEVFYEPGKRWYADRAYPTDDGGLAVYSADVTHRKRVEELAKRNERDLRQLADAMPQVVWIAGEDGRVNYYNRRVKAFGGVRQNGKNSFDWEPGIHPEDKESTISAWRTASEAAEPYSHEHRILMADGTYRWHLSRALPVRGADSEGIRWFGTATDIHDLKTAEDNASHSEIRFERFMQNLPGLAWIKDSEGKYIFANEAAVSSFGRPAEEIYGHTDVEIFPAEIAESFTDNDRLARSNGKGLQTVEALADRNGVVRYSLVNKFSIAGEAEGDLVGGIAIDITEQRAAQKNQEFLFAVAESIRTINEPASLLAAIAESMGRHLDLHRCLFNEIDLANDVETVAGDYSRDGRSVSGTHRISDYSPEASRAMANGETVVNRNSATDPRTADLFDTVYGPADEVSYIAVPLLREGRWVASLWCSDDRPREWTEAEIALAETIAERAWASIERARAEQAMGESEEKFRSLFESIDEGFVIAEVIFDERNQPVDYRFLEANPSFTRLTGLPQDALGKTARDLVPDLEEFWFETYGRVAATGHSVRFEHESDAMGRWFDVHASRVGGPESRRVAIVFNNITERKLHEADLAFLADISRELLLHREADEVIRSVGEMIGRHFDISLCTFVEINEAEDRATVTHDWHSDERGSLVGQYDLADFLSDDYQKAGRAGEIFSVADTGLDPRTDAGRYAELGIGSFACFPLVRDSRWRSLICIHHREAHEWQPRELKLMREVAERIWTRLERIRADQAVVESEERFRNIADSSPVMIWVTEADGYCNFLSKTWYDLTGQTPESALGFGWLDVVHPDDRDTAEEAFNAANANGEPFRIEYRLRRRDGDYRWAIDSARPRFSESGEFLGFIGSVIDITERKSVELALRESEARFRYASDSAPVLIWMSDRIAGRVWFNKPWLEFTGRPMDDQVGHGWEDVLHPEDLDRYRNVYDTAFKSRRAFSMEYRLRQADGEYRWLLDHAVPRTSPDGEFLGFIGSCIDIHDRREAESALRRSEARLQLAMRVGQFGTWDLNCADDQMVWSEKLFDIFGIPITPDRSVSFSRFTEFIHPEDRRMVIDGINEARDSRQIFSEEYRVLRTDASKPTWVRSVAQFFFDSEGTPVRCVGVAQDITEQKSLAETIRVSEAQLRLITDSIPALVSYIDRDEIYRFVNKQYSEWFGMPSEEIIGKTMAEVLGSEAHETLRPRIEAALSGEKITFDTWLNYSGAGLRYVLVSYVPELDAAGEVAGYYALVSDLTGQKRSEDLLHSSEKRMQMLTESFTDYAIISTDNEGRVDSWNPGATNIFGYTEDEILGRSADVLFTPEDRAKGVPNQEMANARHTGRAIDERWHLKKDGSRFFASGVMAPLYVGDVLTGYAKIATDLTERKRNAEALQRAYDEMEIRVLDRTRELATANESLLTEINERKSAERQKISLLQRIVGTQEAERRRIARDLHDHLGQRLTALRLKLASLREACAGDEELYERATRLQQIAELLDSEVSFLAWELRPSALDELGLEEAIETFVKEWSRHYDKQAAFHSTGLGTLRLDSEMETQLYRIVQEALNNVVKHSEAQTVSVLLERTGDNVVLIIEDDGKGFDAERLLNSSRMGRGMGLFGMRERAELIGGTLDIESKPGQGTTIYARVMVPDFARKNANER